MSDASRFWGTINAIAFRHTKTQDVWPSLDFGQQLPVSAQSRLKDTTHPSIVSFGILSAAASLLLGKAQVQSLGNTVTVSYVSSGQQGHRRQIRATVEQSGEVQIEGGVGRTGPFVLTIALGVLGFTHELGEVRERWFLMVRELDRLRGARTAAQPTFSRADLRLASNDPHATHAMMALIDAVYYGLKAIYFAGLLSQSDLDVPPLTAPLPPEVFTVLPGTQVSAAPAASLDQGTEAQLRRVARRGGRVLLTGPTGTGKTESVMNVAVALGRPLFIIKGSPNMEETDFLGGYHMVGGAPEWVDGPFTAAFVRAQTQAVVLLFDELLRADPINLSSTVGVLDHVSETQAALMGIPHLAAGRYYVLRLKNGELVWAPVGNVLFAATTSCTSIRNSCPSIHPQTCGAARTARWPSGACSCGRSWPMRPGTSSSVMRSLLAGWANSGTCWRMSASSA